MEAVDVGEGGGVGGGVGEEVLVRAEMMMVEFPGMVVNEAAGRNS